MELWVRLLNVKNYNKPIPIRKTKRKQILEILSNNYEIPGRVVLSSCYSQPDILYGIIGSGYINNMGFNLSYGNYIIKSNFFLIFF